MSAIDSIELKIKRAGRAKRPLKNGALPPLLSLLTTYYLIDSHSARSAMARKKETTAEELFARAKANGYQRGAHREKDSIRDDNKHREKTKKDQDRYLDVYVKTLLTQLKKMDVPIIERGLS
ncbi:hypothetical protein V8E54_000649 [Elaphomyces granulatus]